MVDKSYYDSVKTMIDTNKLHKKIFEEEISRTGLHRTQHFILMRLLHEEKLPSQKELAKHLNITAAGVTLALSKLESEGLITRESASDTRYNEIKITEAGINIVNQSKESFSKIDLSMFEGISFEEKVIFDKCLKKMKENLENLLNYERDKNEKMD